MFTRGKALVLHPKSGDRMRAARHKAGHGIVDDSLYWYRARTAAEAAYLTVLLNAGCLQQAYADSRASGRHFDLQPWRKVPIPLYDETIALHNQIAALCVRAETIAARTVNEELSERANKGQITLSKAVRIALSDSGIDAAMNDKARQLLPDHAR